VMKERGYASPFEQAGAIIRDRRKEARMTLAAVSSYVKQTYEGLSVSPGHVSTLETGARRKTSGRPSIPSEVTLNAIFEAISMPEEQRDVVKGLYGYGKKDESLNFLNPEARTELERFIDARVDARVDEILSKLRITRVGLRHEG